MTVDVCLTKARQHGLKGDADVSEVLLREHFYIHQFAEACESSNFVPGNGLHKSFADRLRAYKATLA